jgi:hypothetical protein
VKGKEGEMAQEKRTQSIKQREGEGIRDFALRVTTELQKVYGRSPEEKEWRRVVMMGAREATFLEMDNLQSTTAVEVDYNCRDS